MTGRVVTAIAVKILALWFLIQVVIQLPSVGYLALYIQQAFGLALPPEHAFWGVLMVMGVVAFIVVKFLFRLSASILKNLPEENPAVENTLSDGLLIQLAGVLLLVTGLPEIPKSIAAFSQFQGGAEEIYLSAATVEFGFSVLGAIFQVAVSLVMIFGTRKCRDILLRLRGRY